ncbi:MAG: RNA polymerase sigma factor [Planctomycetota bacterium]
MQSDSQLVRALLAGDHQAYGRLFERHERSVLAIAMSVLGNYHAAQDAAQETFVTAYSKLRRLRKASAFGPWVRKIARREAIQMGRRTRQRRNAEQLASQPTRASNDGRIDQANHRLLNAVMRLPKHEQVVVTLRYFDDHSIEAIGEMTGRPGGTVRMQLSRARARLHKWLKESSA